MFTKKNIFKFLFFYLLSSLILILLTQIAETKFFQIFTIEEIGNPDLEWNDLHYKSVNVYQNKHYTREKSVVLINSGSLNKDSFRLELAQVLSKLKELNTKAVGIDHQFSNENKIGTNELIKSINENPKIVLGYIADKNNTARLTNNLKLKSLLGKADLPDDYTIRKYYDNNSTFAHQLVKVAFPNKISNTQHQVEHHPFTIHYSCINDGLVEFSETSNTLKPINFKYIEGKDFINESEAGFNKSFVETFKNKIVIIGHLGTNLIDKKYDSEDKFAVPIDTSKIMLRDKTMYGSVIHANAIENILHPESKFKELHGIWHVLLHQLLIIGFLLVLFLHLGKFFNILILIIISIPYTYGVMKLMDYNVYITMSTTLLHLLFVEEFYEMLAPLYKKITKKNNSTHHENK
jgi:CHASE2 domain-containing sensor protein